MSPRIILFVLGSSWMFVATQSWLLALLFGFDRTRLQSRSALIWNGPLSAPRHWFVFLVHALAYAGWLFPLIYPRSALVMGLGLVLALR